MESLAAVFAELAAQIPPPPGPSKPASERIRACRQRKQVRRLEQIAVLDLETDPFDNQRPTEMIFPFLGVLYSDQFETITIWEDDSETFVSKLIKTIEDLPGEFTIYAHNGGKFDFMFLINRLRGDVSFKGRGIMRAHIGNHEIRDSFHIIPEKLVAMAKDKINYEKMRRHLRNNHRDEIIKYCISDCSNLFRYVRRFVERYGFKISIGAAALAKLGETYRVDHLSPSEDEYLRNFFHGGRVECLQGAGYWKGDYKLYDVNSMYPFAMATYNHPIGSDYMRRPGKPNSQTVFLKLQCKNNGALITHNDNGELTANVGEGEFFTTIWEYSEALRLRLIWDCNILECVDNFQRSDFSKFVLPLYKMRSEAKARLDEIAATLGVHSREYDEANSEVLFLKLIMNNAYGKFAQNPRRFKEHHITDPGQTPQNKDGVNEFGVTPEFMGNDYWIWSRPSPHLRFNNVGTAASITGAARSILMRAIHSATDAVYCDTDSLICRELRDHDLDHLRLGAWDLEKHISELVVCGKKLYAYKTPDGKEPIIVRSKGTAGLSWEDMLGLLVGEARAVTNTGATLTRSQKQYYLTRRIVRTAPLGTNAPTKLLPERNVAC